MCENFEDEIKSDEKEIFWNYFKYQSPSLLAEKIYFKVKQESSALFVKGYEFLSFAKNISKNIGKNISKNFSGKCIQRRLDHPKQSITDALGTILKRAFLKTAELS